MRRLSSLTYTIGLAVMLAAAPAAAQPKGARAGQPSTEAAKADLKDVARHPDKYIGKAIVVDGEVIDVLGPHLFVVDAPRWFHLWGGMLVVVPEPFAAIVQRDAPIRVTGTVEHVVLAEAKRKWAFLNDPKIEVDLFEKPVIVASEVTTITPTVVSLRFQAGQPAPVGTSGSNPGGAITDLTQIARATDSSLVGRRVDASGSVSRVEGEGFWLKSSSGDEVLVLPSSKASVRPSQNVAVQGTVLQSPGGSDAKSASGKKPPIYVYAERVTPK